VCVYVSICVLERERVRECVYVYTYYDGWECVYVCVKERDGETECVSVCMYIYIIMGGKTLSSSLIRVLCSGICYVFA